MRMFMAWRSIVQDQETLNLDAFQRRQADSKAAEWDKTVDARIGETWVWAMAPYQPDPQRPGIEWSINRVSGQDAIAKRAGKRFESDEALLDPARARSAAQGPRSVRPLARSEPRRYQAGARPTLRPICICRVYATGSS